MPYANREAQKKAQREWYMRKYWSDRKFRHAESDRKADWFQNKMAVCNRRGAAKGKP
jgi:hypothetical protein